MAHFTLTRVDSWPNGTGISKANLESLEGKVFALVNGDKGGTWATSSVITLSSSSGGALHLTGPLVLYGGRVAGYGKLSTAGSALIQLDSGDWPRLSSGHADTTRVLPTPCADAKTSPTCGARVDVAAGALRVVACTFELPDGTVQPTTWRLNLRVANGSTIASVAVGYRPILGSPLMRIEAVGSDGIAIPLTSTAAGADANGFLRVSPTDTTTDTATGLPALNTATIPVDGGSNPAQAVVDLANFAYYLRVVEDQTLPQTYPNRLVLKTQVRVATTIALTYPITGTPTIDGITVATGDRVLVKDQTIASQNGIYVVPPSGDWGYAPDADIGGDPALGGKYAQGTIVPVYTGGENVSSFWQLQERVHTLGASLQTWLPIPTDPNAKNAMAGFRALGNLYYQAFVTCREIADDRFQ